MKYNTNSIVLILTLTLTEPVTPYFIRPLVNKLAKVGSSGAGFVFVGARPYLQLLLDFA